MRKAKWALIALPILFVGIQFFRPQKNSAPQIGPDDISKVLAVPQPVLAVLRTSCFDCHSNHTRYPWYAQVAPVSWWIAGHIEEGKEHLNFSSFATYSKKRQLHKLDEIAEAVEQGWMPLKSYKLLHAEANLRASDVKLISDWLKIARAELEVHE